MPPPIPRCSSWARSSLNSPSHFSLPRYGSRVGPHIVLFEACSAFTRVAACTLALSPIRDTLIEGFSHFVTSMTLRLLPAGAIAGWGLHPLESAAFPRRTPLTDVILTPTAPYHTLRIAKGELWVERESAALPPRPRAGHAATHRQPDARKQIAADSVDAIERGHDISCTVDPGRCSGARYEHAAKHRSRHHAF